VVLKGKTSTGKSTFAEAIRTVLGDYGALMTASMLRDNADDKPRPDILAAMHRRLIVAEELGAAQHLHADQIKRLTGATPVTARGMRSNTYVTRVPAFTPWIVCNNVPTIEGADNALKRRILVVPFGVQIKQSDEDINYFTRLIEESAEEILAWAIAGHAAYLDSPSLFDIPAGALGAATEFAEGLNEFSAWLTSQTDMGEEFYDIPRRLYDAYVDWCNENGIKERDQMSNTAFGRKLNDLDIPRVRKTIEGKQVEVRMGIRLTGGRVREVS
jgi:P4 family phage/plasmid primase-like protien